MGDIAGISGAMQSMGQVNSAIINAKAQEQTNASNQQIATSANEWSERMSNTAYQRATTDMKAAGINPMLAYMKGGANTPTPTTARMEAPNYGAVAEAAGNSALDVLKTTTALRGAEAETNLKNVTALTESARAKKEETSAKMAAAELPAAAAEARTREGQAGWDQWSQGWDHVTNRIFEGISNSGKALGNFGKGVFKGGPTPETAREKAHRKVRDNFYKNK